MDLLSVGNLNTHLKNLKLQTQWMLKQKSGNDTAKGKSLEEWLDGTQQQREASAVGEQGDKTLREIHQKLYAGGKLTAKERDYLQEHDPEAYRELVNQEQEQKAYERALRRCKSQEEVDRLRIGRLNTSLVKVRAVEHDPHIPLSKKLEIVTAEKQRIDRVAESTRKFVASGEYAKLPTRAEEEQAREDGAEVPTPAPETRPEAEREDVGAEDYAPEQEADPAAIDLEQPAERKVRRARAKAAYAAAVQPAEQPVGGTITVKA